MTLLAIVGSVQMEYGDAAPHIRAAIEKHRPTAVVSGGARGVDSYASRLAREEYHLPVIECLPAGPSWDYYKPRNLLIAEICTHLVRIYSTGSKTYGSGWTADRAEQMGKPVERIPVIPSLDRLGS